MTMDLDSEYYDRFAHALKIMGKKEKSDEIIEKRNQLFDTN